MEINASMTKNLRSIDNLLNAAELDEVPHKEPSSSSNQKKTLRTKSQVDKINRLSVFVSTKPGQVVKVAKNSCFQNQFQAKYKIKTRDFVDSADENQSKERQKLANLIQN